MIIITREFAVTGLRLVAASEDLIIPASRLGRWKMASQSVWLAVVIAPGGPAIVEDVLLYVALVLTVLSGAYYFMMARRRLFAGKGPEMQDLQPSVNEAIAARSPGTCSARSRSGTSPAASRASTCARSAAATSARRTSFATSGGRGASPSWRATSARASSACSSHEP